uniref:Uncharacterized protein n=1 Tax=Arundo donax TaxID=35708 RepID=A0A0A8Y393_ARUDO
MNQKHKKSKNMFNEGTDGDQKIPRACETVFCLNQSFRPRVIYFATT